MANPKQSIYFTSKRKSIVDECTMSIDVIKPSCLIAFFPHQSNPFFSLVSKNADDNKLPMNKYLLKSVALIFSYIILPRIYKNGGWSIFEVM